jgi:hypothetical protein
MINCDKTTRQKINVDLVLRKMTKQLLRWNKRSLTTLGKILLVKTFGLSQIIYLMQTIYLEDSNLKIFTRQLYNFIWSKRFDPRNFTTDRVKRGILNTSIKLGGYGMIDIKLLRDSICLRNLGRLKETKHPYLRNIYENINFDSYLRPTLQKKDDYTGIGINLLRELRKKQLENDPRLFEMTMVSKVIGNEKWMEHILPGKENSIKAYILRTQRKLRVRDLNLEEIEGIQPILRKDFKAILRGYKRTQCEQRVHKDLFVVTTGKKPKALALSMITSKQFRIELQGEDPVLLYRSGLALTVDETRTWGYRLSKLRSVRHRNILLRVAHGDIYSNERKFRYKLTDSPNCDCGAIETTEHKLMHCERSKDIWGELNINNMEVGNEIKTIVGAEINETMQGMELKAEALLMINSGNINLVKWRYTIDRIRTSKTWKDEELMPEQEGSVETGEPASSETGADDPDCQIEPIGNFLDSGVTSVENLLAETVQVELTDL